MGWAPKQNPNIEESEAEHAELASQQLKQLAQRCEELHCPMVNRLLIGSAPVHWQSSQWNIRLSMKRVEDLDIFELLVSYDFLHYINMNHFSLYQHSIQLSHILSYIQI